jgi:hypothetical protein
VHTIQVGFYQGSDISEGQWKRVPGDTYFPQEIDRLGRNVGPVSIKNPLLSATTTASTRRTWPRSSTAAATLEEVDPKTGTSTTTNR